MIPQQAAAAPCVPCGDCNTWGGGFSRDPSEHMSKTESPTQRCPLQKVSHPPRGCESWQWHGASDQRSSRSPHRLRLTLQASARPRADGCASCFRLPHPLHFDGEMEALPPPKLAEKNAAKLAVEAARKHTDEGGCATEAVPCRSSSSQRLVGPVAASGWMHGSRNCFLSYRHGSGYLHDAPYTYMYQPHLIPGWCC